MTEQQIISPARIATVKETLVLCPINKIYKFMRPDVFSDSNSVQSITFYVVPPGMIADADHVHAIVKVAPKQNTIIKQLVGLVLNPGWSLIAKSTEDKTAILKVSARITRV